MKFKELIEAQHGNTGIIDDYSLLPKAEHSKELFAWDDGFIWEMTPKR